MRALALVLCLSLALALATEVETQVEKGRVKPHSRWGIPSFEDEGTSMSVCPRWPCLDGSGWQGPSVLRVAETIVTSASTPSSHNFVCSPPPSPLPCIPASLSPPACVICQFVVQRMENRIVQHLDRLDAGRPVAYASNTFDPFAATQAPSPAIPGTAHSVGEIGGTGGPGGPGANHMTDLTFEPSIEYKKAQIRSLRSRWGGSSIMRKLFEEFLTDFCAQDRLPEIYVPVCSMMYEHARKIMKLVYYGFPADQVCLMSQLCGKKSYFAAPTAVHDPIMSIYWNNKRGLDGFEGGVAGITKKQMAKRVPK